MKERPIIFSGEMVRAILEGQKTMTRRVVKPRLIPFIEKAALVNGKPCIDLLDIEIPCPYGIPGDRLWVRETWVHLPNNTVLYRATDNERSEAWKMYGEPKWRPSIFMPRWASRILPEITNVRVERLQDITEEDAIGEGIGRQIVHSEDHGWKNYLWHGDFGNFGNYGMGNKQSDAWPYQYSTYRNAKDCFSSLWELINGKKYPWASDPWVWVIEFTPLKAKNF
jgi:hypothetical protein